MALSDDDLIDCMQCGIPYDLEYCCTICALVACSGCTLYGPCRAGGCKLCTGCQLRQECDCDAGMAVKLGSIGDQDSGRLRQTTIKDVAAYEVHHPIEHFRPNDSDPAARVLGTSSRPAFGVKPTALIFDDSTPRHPATMTAMYFWRRPRTLRPVVAIACTMQTSRQ